tara:strand:+ start:7217 stop:7324 length:108 start_codon:yes stop_codon:yes gene_type:complete
MKSQGQYRDIDSGSAAANPPHPRAAISHEMHYFII